MPDTEAAAGTESETPAKRDSKPAVESRELVRGGEICAARARVLSDDCGGGAVWWERRCVCVRAWRGCCACACARSLSLSPFFTAQMWFVYLPCSAYLAASRSGTALSR